MEGETGNIFRLWSLLYLLICFPFQRPSQEHKKKLAFAFLIVYCGRMLRRQSFIILLSQNGMETALNVIFLALHTERCITDTTTVPETCRGPPSSTLLLVQESGRGLSLSLTILQQ